MMKIREIDWKSDTKADGDAKGSTSSTKGGKKKGGSAESIAGKQYCPAAWFLALWRHLNARKN